MKKLTIGMVLSLLIGWVTFPSILYSGLIEPTRTLETATDDLGMLNVYSEPPGLAVRLDGKAIGKTPIVSVELSSGAHVLHIQGTESKFFLGPREAISLSWFKGSFIRIPEKAKTADEPTAESKQKGTMLRQRENAGSKEGISNDPFYWPLNPRGPIQ
jgi:hypothetical protein